MLCKKKSAIENLISNAESKVKSRGIDETHLGFFSELYDTVKKKLESVTVTPDGKVVVQEKQNTQPKIILPPKPVQKESPFLPLALVAMCVYFIAKRR